MEGVGFALCGSSFFLMMHVIYRRANSTDALRASARELRSRALLLHVEMNYHIDKIQPKKGYSFFIIPL